jgi:hypothetical protein
MASVKDFFESDFVRYVPFVAHGDESHPECKTGVVVRITEHFVFVLFNAYPPTGCLPSDLVLLYRREL